MFLVDANLLIYAYAPELPHYEAARRWLEERLNGTDPVGLPWTVLLAFLRVMTHPRVFARPAPVAEAWGKVEGWLARPNVWIPGPTEAHQAVLGRLLPATAGRPNLIADAHLAALAIEHGLLLCSADADFARFPGLRWTNPLLG